MNVLKSMWGGFVFGAGVIAMLLVVIIYTNYVYDKGVDDGYWEHEGEENAYSCEVFSG